MRLKQAFMYSCTFSLLLVCSILFLWNEKQSFTIEKSKGELALSVGLTPIQRSLFFDYPQTMACLEKVITKYNIRSAGEISKLSPIAQRQFHQAEQIPMWMGATLETIQWFYTGEKPEKAPLFEKIGQGQVWRFFTPSLIHKDLFHLLFNMGWLLLLGLQIERRISKIRFILLVLLIGSLSNTAQYFMGGAYFLGFSGVVAGLTGFIWIRQKKAPEEKYPLPRATALFVFYFILAMMFLDGLSLALKMMFSITVPINIANTAHIVGGLTGLVLGRFSFFSRGVG